MIIKLHTIQICPAVISPRKFGYLKFNTSNNLFFDRSKAIFFQTKEVFGRSNKRAKKLQLLWPPPSSFEPPEVGHLIFHYSPTLKRPSALYLHSPPSILNFWVREGNTLLQIPSRSNNIIDKAVKNFDA